MKINIPWKVLNIVKRYAMTIEASLMKKRPKDHVRPSRHSRAKAPITQDLVDAIQRHRQIEDKRQVYEFDPQLPSKQKAETCKR